jgi:ElaB/YqjD/DUF883 family membrane-anchored ribosome-binding protein
MFTPLLFDLFNVSRSGTTRAKPSIMKKHAKAHHEKVTEHAKHLLAATSHITESKVAEAHNKLSELLESAKDSVEYVEERAEEAAKQATTYIKEKPLQAVGLAIGIGALLGFCIARRNK